MEQNKTLEEQIEEIIIQHAPSIHGMQMQSMNEAFQEVAQRYALEQQIEMLDKLKRDPDASISAYYLQEALKKELRELSNGKE
jgi:hypothetical protein